MQSTGRGQIWSHIGDRAASAALSTKNTMLSKVSSTKSAMHDVLLASQHTVTRRFFPRRGSLFIMCLLALI
jgi:hypothetical protein